MKTLNIHEAKTHLSAVLAEIQRTGQRVVICKNGAPIADLVPHAKRRRSEVHPTLRRISVYYDPTEPLNEEDWPEEGR